jgi:alpha-galactosidase
MTLPTTITVIGAGSASFGENTLSAIMNSKKLRGSTLRLVDRNPHSLDIVYRLANRLNAEWDAQFKISAHTSHQDALEGAQFVVSAIEVGPREELWKKDYELTIKHGLRQPYGENGGPGGFAHAARNIGPLMGILRDMEQACPEAWFVNFTNPMVRICDAVNRHSRIKSVGLCHQIYAGYVMVGAALAKDFGIEVPPELTGMHAAVDQYAIASANRSSRWWISAPPGRITSVGSFRSMTGARARTCIRSSASASSNCPRNSSR